MMNPNPFDSLKNFTVPVSITKKIKKMNDWRTANTKVEN